ncbi:MAG: tetratricopeptide repeat-containing glycosyltransferase family protein [Rhodospirillales bacterium]
MISLEQSALQLKSAGRFAEAASAFSQLIKLQPKNHVHHYNLGNTYLAANQPADAIEPYRRAVRLAPRFAPAHNNLGLALLATGQIPLAATSFIRALSLDPGSPGTQHMAGHALLRSGKPLEAMRYLREADRLAPHQAAIVTDLADAMRLSGKLRDVAPLAREAASLAPDRIEAWNNLSIALRDIAEFDEAEQASRTALRLNPENSDAHYNLALTLLVAGRLREAWPHWEYRWRGAVGVAPRFAEPPWDGSKLDDGVLYLHAEQGLGDTIQFSRFATMAGRRAKLVLGVQPPLVRLLRTLDGVDNVVSLDDPTPEFAAHSPLVSLPGAFATSLETIPADVPYLHPPADEAAAWAARLATLPGSRVGLVWAGNPDYPFDHARSIPAAALAALGGIAGISFVSLQLGRVARPPLDLTDWTEELGDFAATAALVAGLDLVIGVDTAVIHLAGALARPVWLLNRFAGDWRWGATGSGTPWYPSLRQFRQPEPGDWGPVLAEVRAALVAMKM